MSVHADAYSHGRQLVAQLVEINPLAVLERGAVKARRAHGLDALVGSLLSFAPEAVVMARVRCGALSEWSRGRTRRSATRRHWSRRQS